MRFAGGNPGAVVDGIEPIPGASNYLVGPDPSRWTTGVRNYGRVRYRALYPGVDVEFYGSPNGLEYDFLVQPGADPSRIQLSFSGADSL